MSKASVPRFEVWRPGCVQSGGWRGVHNIRGCIGCSELVGFLSAVEDIEVA